MVVENSGARRSRHCGNGGRSARTDLGETEVENLGLAAGGHKNIGWLDVAVDDAFGVRGVQRVGHLAPQVQKEAQRERAARDAITKGAAVEVLHEEKTAAGGVADVITGPT